MACNGCGSEDMMQLLDLGLQPISNDLLSSKSELSLEPKYPLQVLSCLRCAFVQIKPVASREALFKEDYVYFSSFSSSWLKHSQKYAERMIQELSLSSNDLVLEIASNDGYLLKYFKEANIRVIGIEPAKSVAKFAVEGGIDTRIEFFGSELALEMSREGISPSLVIGNNVLAHVPDIHDFIRGISLLLKNDAIATFEFPHLLQLLKNNQFDTIYHEHYSYLSITALNPIFESHGLRIYKVEELVTHGGSLRVFLCLESSTRKTEGSVSSIERLESEFDPRRSSVINTFAKSVSRVKDELVQELTDLVQSGANIVAYGAAAKGNTLLNYCEIDSSIIKAVGDLNPMKQEKFLPGTGIPVVSPSNLIEYLPDVILVLPWNLSEEIKTQLMQDGLRNLKFLRAIPRLEYF